MLPSYVIAELQTIRLICTYSHTLNLEKNETKVTGGEYLVTVHQDKDGTAVIKKDDLDAEFIGEVTEEYITGKADYKIQDINVKQSLSINRYTGFFEVSFELPNKSGGLIHYGNCNIAKEKLF